MTRATTITSTIALFAAGMSALVIAAATPARAQDIPQGWYKVCAEQEEVNVCNVQNLMIAESGQLLTGVSLIRLEGNVNRQVFQVTVPSGRMVPPGIGMQIDGGQTQKLDYVICLPDRCIAEAPLNDQLVNSFKRGQRVTFTSVNFQNQQNPIQVSLAGFTAAYDGPALQQSDFEERQRQLQDYVNRNNQGLADKLREEQERAKQATD